MLKNASSPGGICTGGIKRIASFLLIPVVQHLPGGGKNFQDHPAIGCIWEYQEALPPRNNMGEATFFWKSTSEMESPDLQVCQAEIPLSSAENIARFGLPESAWTLLAGVVRPKSRGHLRLTGPGPLDPVEIEANVQSHPDDLKAAIACVELCREIGNSAALCPFAECEVMPGNLKGAALEHFIRDALMTYSHETRTAKMGRGPLSVVDGHLSVYGIRHLRVADGSIMPRVTNGNTQAPYVIIDERAAEVLRTEYRL